MRESFILEATRDRSSASDSEPRERGVVLAFPLGTRRGPAALEVFPGQGLAGQASSERFYPRLGKRTVAWLLLCLTLPAALLISLPIALVNGFLFRNPRRILFLQERIGRDGKRFWIYKFRTMREESADEFGSWRDGSDRLRVTPFGRFLRNTHLDELPQLLNVLKGEMDFIGPRPEMVDIDRWARERIEGFHERNALLPGITGYAQITQGYAGMDETAYRRKLSADRYYRDHISLALDLEILARTLVWMLRGKGWRRKVLV